jgi:hypothetical protein
MDSQLTIDQFWDAVLRQEYETVRKAIAEGFDVNAKIPGKIAPIIFAQPAEDMVMLKILWGAGATPVNPWLEAVFSDFASGGDGLKLKTRPQKRKPVGKFILHRFNGDEEFALEEALMRIEREAEHTSVHLEVRTNGTVIKSLPDTEGLNGAPNAEITLTLSGDNPADLIGKVLMVDEGYDAETEDYIAMIYYVEHEVLDANEVEFIAKKKNSYKIRWRGTTTDVNYYDGSKPDTHVEDRGLVYAELSRLDRSHLRGPCIGFVRAGLSPSSKTSVRSVPLVVQILCFRSMTRSMQ